MLWSVLFKYIGLDIAFYTSRLRLNCTYI